MRLVRCFEVRHPVLWTVQHASSVSHQFAASRNGIPLRCPYMESMARTLVIKGDSFEQLEEKVLRAMFVPSSV